MEASKKLRTKIGKLLSGTRKTNEGFAEVFHYEPKDFLEKQHGNMYFVVEVASGSKAAVDVGEAVINAIRDEYYEDLNRSVILSMESALRKANEELSDFASAGETDWIGKLNVVCAVISEEKLHLSKVGATEAYILRGTKITHISEGMVPETDDEDKKHPLKTFSSITSGKLEHHDKILLSTSELFSHISLSGIKKIIQENSPSQSMVRLKDVLKSEEGIGSIGTLVVEMVTEEELSEERGEEMDEIWIEEPKAGQAAKNIAAGAVTGVSGFFKKLGDNIREKAVPSIKETASQAKNAIKGETPETKEDTNEETGIKKENKSEKKKPETKKENFFSFVTSYFKNFSFENFIKDVKKSFSGIGKAVQKQAGAKYFKYLAGAIALLAISLVLIFFNYYGTKNKEDAQTKLDRATQLYEDAQTALVYEARNEAKEYLTESQSLAKQVEETKYFDNEIEALLTKINTSLEEANGIFAVSPTEVIEFTEISPSTFAMNDKNIFALDTNAKKVSIYNVETKETKVVELETLNNPISIVSQPRVDNILVLTDSKEVFEIDINDFTLNKASTAANEFKSGSFLDTYLSNMYIVTPFDNQIYRYTRLATTFSSPSNYIQDDSVDISDAVSTAFPGTVLVLHETGEVTKMLSGRKQAFGLSNMPWAFETPSRIINNIDSDRIYILDKNKGVASFKLDGTYEKTSSLKDYSDLKDFYVDEDSGIIYLLTGNKIVQFGK